MNLMTDKIWCENRWIDAYGDKMLGGFFVFRAWSIDGDCYEFAVYESLRDIAFQDAVDYALNVFGENIRTLECHGSIKL